MKRWPALLAFVVACSALGIAPNVSAGVPSPPNSFVDPCLRVCPGGDMLFRVIVRDAASNPVASSFVTVDFCNCPQVALCPLLPGSPYGISGCIVVMSTNAAGVVDIPIRAGGACQGPVVVSADGVILTSRTVVSPDLNGDQVVDATDQAILASMVPSPGSAYGDLNCSFALDAGDLAVQSLHLGHACSGVVPVRPPSWGTIKLLYR